jgi:hypothetical protein
MMPPAMPIKPDKNAVASVVKIRTIESSIGDMK